MATSFRLLVKRWIFSPGGVSCYLVSGFTLLAARFVHKHIISKEVCRVFVLRYHSTSPILPVLSRFIEFTCHMQLYSRTVIYSLYSHTNHIHSYIRHIYTFIHRYFHIFIHIIYTASFTHDYISHPESCFGHVSSVRSLLVIVSSPKFLQRNILNLPSCHQKCHPQCVWSRDVTHYKPGGFRQIFY